MESNLLGVLIVRKWNGTIKLAEDKNNCLKRVLDSNILKKA